MAFIYEAAAMSLTSCSIDRVAILNNLLFHVYSGLYLYTIMAEFHLPTEGHERLYLRGELKSLGLSQTRIDQLTNDSDDNNDLRSLVQATKEDLLRQFNEAHK
jgi:hypothetical protein